MFYRYTNDPEQPSQGAERPGDVRLARTGVERRLRTLKNLLLRQARMPFRHSRISIPGET